MGGGCGGCPYHSFPYTALLPVVIDGKRENKVFNNKQDVLDVIDILIEEIHEFNQEGNEFDIAQSINSQLPFFTCINILIDKEIQKDIQRYIYCKDLNVSPYQGNFGQQPALWIDKYFIIKKVFAKMEQQKISESKSKVGR